MGCSFFIIDAPTIRTQPSHVGHSAPGCRAVDRYDSAIAYCDDEIGRLLRAVDARLDRARVVTVLFSDHGELFGEHGFENHGNTLSEPDVRALLLVHAPGAQRVATVESPVSLVDIHPTLLDLAGVELDSSSAAWSLLPFLRAGGAAPPPRPLFLFADLTRTAYVIRRRGVVSSPYKLVRDLSTGGTELFNVEADPAERSDLSETQARERVELEDLLDSWTAPH